jgi:uncharacterized membrane protein (UPF0127 family)
VSALAAGIVAALVVGFVVLPARGRAQDAVGACGDAAFPYAEVQIDTFPRIDLELARTSAEHQRGLMERDYLPPDSGMLFVYTAESNEAYWMYQTLLSLSIAFIDRSGVIVDIRDMPRNDDPYDVTEASRKTYPSAAPYWYALEVNQGWFFEHGVGVGQQITFCLGS